MKVTIENGIVVARAENDTEAIALLHLNNPARIVKSYENGRKLHGKTPCPECGEIYKNAGLSLHRYRKHSGKN